ncbi:MAG: V-type ATP synthase subunit F [Spirochaetes bacterium]|nr:V-type ATP synthase subunit F [Spirochaetota bacterium]
MTFYVLGDEDVVIGFQFAGIHGKVIEDQQEALTEFENCIHGSYGDLGVLLITEKIAILLEEEITHWQLTGGFPLIVEIPDLDGHMEEKKTLLQLIREAIGLSV